ncbi:hypothetical protein SAMN05216503_2217 [Polaribacter sp. KT25b]|uniref:transposase n=1 Tax=Polaribacter sp. KT25b TaxID=1855336 RepID=UPI00087AF3DA|nr:transposase [Polaribacter sp. KT25b]SDS17575.1 hypothetical protein SAMN05216503_2217 [Polaribacter sp. KT25b]
MKHYNLKKHNRKSIRLKGYDYAQNGLYFITICIQKRVCLLGNIINETLETNNAGKMIDKWYWELENKFPNIKCHAHIVMPNHFHCIIEIVHNVGADLCVRPNTNTDLRVRPNTDLHVRPNTANKNKPIPTKNDLETNDNAFVSNVNVPVSNKNVPVSNKNVPVSNVNVPFSNANVPIMGEHIGSPLHVVVQWFKTMTTNEYIRNVKTNNWQRFNGKLWQRNYWEHIIRNEKSYQNISEYIMNNPTKWIADKLNPNNISN